jgi:hypothetical protein
MLKAIIKVCLSFRTRYYTLSQVVKLTGFDRKTVRHKLWKLESAGLIKRVSSKKIKLPNLSIGKEICYRNILQALREKTKPPRPQKENGWDKMWKAIRALRQFTREDLAILCEQNIYNVRFFTKRYRKLGYIRPLREGGRNVLWVLIKDAGPRRPLEGNPETLRVRR